MRNARILIPAVLILVSAIGLLYTCGEPDTARLRVCPEPQKIEHWTWVLQCLAAGGRPRECQSEAKEHFCARAAHVERGYGAFAKWVPCYEARKGAEQEACSRKMVTP